MIRLSVHVHPGSRAESVGGSYSGALVVKVRERAVDGAANEAVVVALARAFNVPASSISLLRGRRSRSKFLEIDGDANSLMRRHEELLEGS